MNEFVASKTVVTWAVNIIKSSHLLPLFSSLIKEYCSRRIQSASLQPFPFMRQRRTLTLFFFFLLLLHWFPFYSWSQAYQFSNESVKEPWGCRGTKRAAICKSIATLLNRSAWDGKKKQFVDVHTTITPFVRKLVRYLHFRVEFNSWSELEIFVHGLINSFCLMNDLDSWNLQQVSIHRHRGCISSECSFSALLLFSAFIFLYFNQHCFIASFCIPLLCKRT